MDSCFSRFVKSKVSEKTVHHFRCCRLLSPLFRFPQLSTEKSKGCKYIYFFTIAYFSHSYFLLMARRADNFFYVPVLYGTNFVLSSYVDQEAFQGFHRSRLISYTDHVKPKHSNYNRLFT